MFFRRPSTELGSALLLALPSLVMIPLGMLAPAMTLNQMNEAVNFDTDVATVLSTGSKPMAIVLGLLKVMLSGFSSAGTYAFNKNLISRMKQLFAYSYVIPFGILLVIYPFLIWMPNLYMQIWLPEEKYKPLVSEYIPLFFYGVWFDVIAQGFFFLMLAMNTPFNALGEAILKYAFQIAISFIMGAIYPTNARAIGYCYLMTSIADFVLGILFLICPFYKYLKKKNDPNVSNSQVETPLINE